MNTVVVGKEVLEILLEVAAVAVAVEAAAAAIVVAAMFVEGFVGGFVENLGWSLGLDSLADLSLYSRENQGVQPQMHAFRCREYTFCHRRADKSLDVS